MLPSNPVLAPTQDLHLLPGDHTQEEDRPVAQLKDTTEGSLPCSLQWSCPLATLHSQLSNFNRTLQGMDIHLRQKDVEMASAASDKEIAEKQWDAAVERQVLAEAELEHAKELLAELEGRLEVLITPAQKNEQATRVTRV